VARRASPRPKRWAAIAAAAVGSGIVIETSPR
jgi:hypothetical protein